MPYAGIYMIMNMELVQLLFIYLFLSTQGVNNPIIIFPSFVRWPSFSDVMSTMMKKQHKDEISDSLIG